MGPLSPLREYSYLAMILGLLVAFGWWSAHERSVQHTKDVAAAMAADKKEADHVKAIEDKANAAISDLQTRLSNALAVTPVPSVSVRLCKYAAVSQPSSAVGPSGPPRDAAAGPSSGLGDDDQGIDVAPATEVILARDKAVISYLQDYIRKCQDAGVCKK